MSKGLFVDFGVGLTKFRNNVRDMKKTWADAMKDLEDKAKKTFTKVNAAQAKAASGSGVFSDAWGGSSNAMRRPDFRNAYTKSIERNMRFYNTNALRAKRIATMYSIKGANKTAPWAQPMAGPTVNPAATKNSVSLIDRLTDAYKRLKKSRDEDSGSSSKHNTALKLENSYFSRLRYQIVATVTAYLSYRAIDRYIRYTVGQGQALENNAFKGSVMFGNKGNYLKAYDLAQKLSTQGKSGFQTDDLVEGFQKMMYAGIDAKKNYKWVSNVAGATGQKFSETANNLSSAVYGNSDVMRQYGATNAQVKSLDLWGHTPQQRKAMIVAMLKDNKLFINGAKEQAQTLTGIFNQIGSKWEMFVQKIIGKPSDKNSLYTAIKNMFQKINNFFDRNSERIGRFAYAAAETFKWMVKQIEGVGRYLARKAESFLSIFDGSETTFKQKIAKFILWLDLTKLKVKRFFDDWGWLIKDFIYFRMGAWLLGKLGVTGLIGGLIKGLFGTATETTAAAIIGKWFGRALMTGLTTGIGQVILKFGKAGIYNWIAQSLFGSPELSAKDQDAQQSAAFAKAGGGNVVNRARKLLGISGSLTRLNMSDPANVSLMNKANTLMNGLSDKDDYLKWGITSGHVVPRNGKGDMKWYQQYMANRNNPDWELSSYNAAPERWKTDNSVLMADKYRGNPAVKDYDNAINNGGLTDTTITTIQHLEINITTADPASAGKAVTKELDKVTRENAAKGGNPNLVPGKGSKPLNNTFKIPG